MNKNFFYILWKFILNLIKEPVKKNQILFLKFDAIGDFFILQSALKYFDVKRLNILIKKEHEPIVRYFFNNIKFGEIIYLDKKKYIFNPFYTFKILKHIKKNYQVVNLRSRTLPYLEKLLIEISSSEKINNKINEPLSDYNRIKLILINYFKINQKQYCLNKKNNENYVAISPFSTDSRRDVPLKKLINYASKFKLKIKVIVQSLNNLDIHTNRNKNVDFILTKSVVDYVGILKNSKHIVSNDSSAGHIGLFFGIDTHVFLGGGQPNQFYPYSNSVIDNNLNLIKNLPDCSGCNWDCKFPLINNKYKCIAQLSSQ